MPKVTALLITSDSTLSNALQEVTDSVSVLHLGRRKSDADEVARLLERGRIQRRKVAMIVISDQPNPELALALSSAGMAEFLERPLNLHRLSYLADVLTIRARHQTQPADCQ